MNSHALVIDGRLVTTTEQDPVVNPCDRGAVRHCVARDRGAR